MSATEPDQPASSTVRTTLGSRPDQPPVGRRRVFWMGGTAAAAVAGMAAGVSPAGAAPGSTAWRCGGNSGIKSNGKNFLGPTNAVPLVFKTTPSGGSPKERMRIAPNGRVGIGTRGPRMPLDVKGNAASVILGTNTGTSPSGAGVSGVSATGVGVAGDSADGVGLAGTSATGSGVTGTSTGGVGVAGTSSTGDGVTGVSTGGDGVTGNSADNSGVRGAGGYAGAVGVGGTYGGIFSGTSYGLYSYGGPTGVFGSGGSYGVYGSSGSGQGVYGSGQVGVYGVTANVNSAAVQGAGGQYAVRGINARTAGVRGESSYVGVWGEGPAYGIYGLASGSGGYGVMGQATGAATWGLYSLGNCGVQGTLTKLAGSFRIDHPLDPEHRYLSHSFVESPDMMNVYNGTAVLDGSGEVEVTLPDYFEVLNRDFRYQLTAIGAPSPDLHVKAEIKGNRFAIGGGAPGSTVSWQVTGVRQDDYAKAHPIVVEENKPAEQRGTRLFSPRGSASRQFVPRAAATRAPASTAPLAEPARPRPRLD